MDGCFARAMREGAGKTIMSDKSSDKRRRSRRGDEHDNDPLFPLALPSGDMLRQDRRQNPDRRLEGISVEFLDEVEDVQVTPVPDSK